MAASEVNLEDYSLYSHLSDEELLQIAVERSLQLTPYSVQSTSSSSSATPAPAAPYQTNPRQRYPDPHRHLPYIPLNQPPPPDTLHVPNCANSPKGQSQFNYSAPKREFSPLQSLIINGDAEALMNLVRRRSGSLMEPNDEGWIALHEAAYYGQLQCVSILIRVPPRPLLQLCRLQILQLVGHRRVKKLPLPGGLIRFLKHQEGSVEDC
ncbi:ankyrin repeat and SOCS box protein 2-like [Micropterus dolomieu]|uniref:ankyrin repeat and SOCS box protein 2-like n=1 Tax=Micropterus dolomieu TaxID=147949 RepID=UPI001E8D1AC9|nr:ankyrin repeat and SOCS box protein 2-like [Micropterus dolomieu]